MNFKKINLFVATLAMAGAMAPVVAAHADNTTDPTKAQGTTRIEFQKASGSQGLTLDKAPSFEFNNHDITANMSMDYDANQSTPIQVTDLTGSSDGYHVTPQANNLTLDGNTSVVLPVSQLSMTVADGAKNTSGGYVHGTTGTQIFGAAATVATGDANTNGTNASGNTNSHIKLSGNQVKAGTYNGTIDYTVATGLN